MMKTNHLFEIIFTDGIFIDRSMKCKREKERTKFANFQNMHIFLFVFLLRLKHLFRIYSTKTMCMKNKNEIKLFDK